MKNTIESTAVWNENHYYHFGITSQLAALYGDDPKDIITLKLQISDDQTVPETHMKEADYWGWLKKEDDDFTMIYAQRFLLNMCFAYGIKVTEEAGKGKAYRLEIV